MVRQIALGNGSLLVNLDSSLQLRDLYFPYAGQENHVLGEKNRVGIHGDGFSWIEDWDTEPRYMDETIVTESKAMNDAEGLEMEFRSCVHCDSNVFLREIEVKNSRDEQRTVELFFEQRFDMYGSGMADTCVFRPEENGLVHYKNRRYVMVDVKKKGGSSHDYSQYGIYRGDPGGDISAGDLNGSPVAQGDVCSVISIELELEPASSETIYYWINTGKNFDQVRELNHHVEDRIENYFDQTAMCWRGFLGSLDCDTSNLEEHEERQLKRSILVMRSQTNDNGAITAANDSSNLEFNQDKYGYVWPRDAALVAAVMAEAGYSDLVRPFFDFAEDVIEEEGYMLHKYNPNKSLGSSWHPWVGEDGKRELPIQEDETALVIWALKVYHDVTGDIDILEQKWDGLVKPAADFMMDYFDEELSLPEPSHDLWEERRYVSTFTVASVYAGLEAAADIAEILGEDGERYRDRAAEIKQEGLENLRSEEKKRYGRGIEDGELDESVGAEIFFLIKFGLVDGDDEYFTNTMEAVMHDLSPETEIGGIARYRGDRYHNVTDDFDRVPGNPWVICTLWAAQYLMRTASNLEELEEAQDYMHWTCENSLETGLLPEQVDPFTGEGKSVAPLTWSHTTFIQTALMYSSKKEELS